MTFEAPKLSTLVDDFRILQVDQLNWSITGAPTVLATDTATTMRGISLGASQSVSSANTTGGRRLDLWDSEVVWIIGRWGVGSLNTLSITQAGGNFGYRFEFLNGVLTVKSIESGVTYTGANFLTGAGATVNWGQTLKYMRIAHNASNGRVEFYAGTNPDGSDQRLMTSDLGSGAKGTLTPAQSSIDNMTITMSVAASASQSMYVRAVNAPAGGLQRNPDRPAMYYYRDFSTWTGYVTNRFIDTTGAQNHEYRVMAANTGVACAVNDVDVTTRCLIMYGDGGSAGRTAIRTGFASGIKDVNMEVNLAITSFTDTTSYAGLFWRNASSTINHTTQNRYQLNIFEDRVRLDVFYNDALWNDNYGVLGTDYITLVETALATELGVKYNYKINHYENRIVVIRDDVEIFSFNDSINYIRDPGHIGLDVGSTTAASFSNTTFVIYDVAVTTASDDQSFVTGIAMQDRGLGAHVKSGARDTTQVTMATDPSIVSSLETSLKTKLKTVYHFTSTAAPTPGTAPVDTAVIGAAQAQAQLGRTNVININAIRPRLADFSPTMTAQYQSDLLAWSNALNSIKGTVYATILPYPDVNVPWSPNAYNKVFNIASAGNTFIQPTGGGLVTNAHVGQVIRYQNSAGVMNWATITSNSTTQINFAAQPITPLSGTNCWLYDTSAHRLLSPTEYITVYRAIVTYMKSVGCRANFVFAMNWAPDSATKRGTPTASSGQAYANTFSDFYPGDDYVDAFMIRAINLGVRKFATGYGFQMWRPLERMLEGETAQSVDYTYPYALKQGPYYKMQAQASGKKMFVLAGCAETHSLYNDLSTGFAGMTISSSAPAGSSATNDEFAASNMKWWRPASIAEYNPRSDSVAQYGVSHTTVSTGNEGYLVWTVPTTSVTQLAARCYFRVDTLGSSAAGIIIKMRNGSGTIAALRVNQATGQLSAVTLAGGAGTTLAGSNIVAGGWYRADILWENNVASFRVVRILTNNNDRPDSATLATATVATSGGQPTSVQFGNLLSNVASSIQSGMEIQDPKISLDGQITTFNKGQWVRDALNLRGFPGVTQMILVSADQFSDVPAVSVTIDNGYPMFYTNAPVDTRLNGAKYTAAVIKDAISVATPARAHTAPQIRQVGYVATASVGNLEYMYLRETGKVPLYLTPRLGGIMLRDFNFGQATVRAAQEDRPSADGVRDYSKYVGAKPVTLSFVTFDDASGSAAFYADVLNTWSNPRRRPQLVYKLKDGEERFINLRPEPTDAGWTVDGVRTGFKEVVLSFSGIDGKDYSSAVNNALMRQAVMTQVTTDGTAATPPKIRIYGGSTGCTNPTIILQSAEQLEGNASARISLGSTTSTVFVPANQFIEIDMDRRTVQLNGLAGNGNSYLKYLSDRQWFYLETYYNTLYLETDDGNGFAAVIYRDAYL